MPGRRLGLSGTAQSALEAKDARYLQGGYVAYFLVALPVFLAVGASIWLAVKHVIPAGFAFIPLSTAVMFSYVTQEDRTRIWIDCRLEAASARRLSSWESVLLGRRGDGTPVKWAALLLFIAGSLLDLIWG